MSLVDAVDVHGRRIGPSGPAPVAASDLEGLVDQPFLLPADDPWVEAAGTREHAYLEAARRAWDDDPVYIDTLDPASPYHALKLLERDLYLHHWAPWWAQAREVLDVGCGVGRFVLPLLDRGATVVGVDGDLRSLQRCAWRAAGRAGRLDLHWSSVHVLPQIQVDTVLAVEVLCYVPGHAAALAQIARRLKPGGVLLLSMEARWGWAASTDAAPGSVGHALVGDGVVDLGEEGWARTWDAAPLVSALEDAGLSPELVEPTHWVLDGPLEQAAGELAHLDVVLDLEAACRAHPVWSPLHRIWTVAAIKR